MTKNIDVVRAWYKESQTNPPASSLKASAEYLSDDFKSYDANGNVAMNKETFMGMSHLLFAAFEDLMVDYEDIREDGDDVVVKFHFEGTHTGDLDLSALGMGVIPASGKKIVWPQGTSRFKVEGGKIVSEIPIVGGMEAFFEPLGVQLPKA